MTDVGDNTYRGPRVRADTAPPYRVRVNEALVDLLMMAPGAPELPTLEDFLRLPPWHQRAACQGMGPGAFIRSEKADYGARRWSSATAVRSARDCPEAALADPDLVGLWGGTTDAERREIRRLRVA
jgi:Transcription factor WhiB